MVEVNLFLCLSTRHGQGVEVRRSEFNSRQRLSSLDRLLGPPSTLRGGGGPSAEKKPPEHNDDVV